jgi:hypothetical protein
MLNTGGIAESVVMELVGHDRVEASRHYTHTGREAFKVAVQALPELSICKKSRLAATRAFFAAAARADERIGVHQGTQQFL